MPKLTATGKLRYDKRSLVKDEEFDASDKDAKVLVAIGKAKYATVAKAQYQTRVMTAATEAKTEPLPSVPTRSATLTLPKKTEPASTKVGAQTFKPV